MQSSSIFLLFLDCFFCTQPTGFGRRRSARVASLLLGHQERQITNHICTRGQLTWRGGKPEWLQRIHEDRGRTRTTLEWHCEPLQPLEPECQLQLKLSGQPNCFSVLSATFLSLKQARETCVLFQCAFLYRQQSSEFKCLPRPPRSYETALSHKRAAKW